ncbi:hypothetical protein Tco_0320248 [Tanacetum coccineum]
MPPKKTSTSEAPTMTQAAIRKLVADSLLMSSPNHPTFDIEDAFSSNFPDYISASLDYVPASRNINIQALHDNSFAKESPIPPPTIVPPSSMLSPMFNPQEFFLPEELLPLKKQVMTNHPPLLLPHLKNLR